MGPERNFLSLSGNLSEIFGTGTERFPKSKIRNGTGTERQFFGNFLSFPERFLSHFLVQNSMIWRKKLKDWQQKLSFLVQFKSEIMKLWWKWYEEDIISQKSPHIMAPGLTK